MTRIDVVKLGTNKDTPALLDIAGCVSSRVGLAMRLYPAMPRPTISMEGVFAMANKICRKCKQERDLSEFYPDKRAKDGLRSHCKSCCAEYQARYKKEHREEINEYHRVYYAQHSEAVRSRRRASYLRNRDREINYHRAKRAANPEDNRRRCKERYYANRDSEKQRVLRWIKNHPEKHRASGAKRRALKKAVGGVHTGDDIKRHGDTQKWRCWWCGEKCADNYHVDHLVPLSRGGHNGPSNLVIACPSCNCSKNDKLPEEWAGRLF